MGRLMDAILAVSALVMASVVAWADWVMSCCGVSSEAMFQMLDGPIMARLVQKQGEDTKMAVSWEPSVQFTSKFDTM